jgi:hypothetical protein
MVGLEFFIWLWEFSFILDAIETKLNTFVD